MTVQDLQTSNVQVPNGEILIEAYLSQPRIPGPLPAVIVFQEVFGVNDHIRAVTDRIAQLGYIAIAPALYQRTAPGFEVGYTTADLALGRTYKNQTTAAELISDTQATIAYLKSLPQFPGRAMVIDEPNSHGQQSTAIGTIGFCFGGHVAYLVATLPEIKATASFYGAGIAMMPPGGGVPTLSRTGEIQGTLYAFFGNQDSLISSQEVDQIAKTLQHHHIDHRIFRFEADHGFCCDQRQSYQPEAAAAAWQQVESLFHSKLKAVRN